VRFWQKTLQVFYIVLSAIIQHLSYGVSDDVDVIMHKYILQALKHFRAKEPQILNVDFFHTRGHHPWHNIRMPYLKRVMAVGIGGVFKPLGFALAQNVIKTLGIHCLWVIEIKSTIHHATPNKAEMRDIQRPAMPDDFSNHRLFLK